jgi:hypothetical protein
MLPITDDLRCLSELLFVHKPVAVTLPPLPWDPAVFLTELKPAAAGKPISIEANCPQAA